MFEKAGEFTFVPRAAEVEVEAEADIKGSLIGTVSTPGNFVFDISSDCNNGAEGQHTAGAGLIDEFVNASIKEAHARGTHSSASLDIILL